MSFCFGASDEARTRYLHLGKVALYQMSYTRSDKWYYSRNLNHVKKKITKTKNYRPPLQPASCSGAVQAGTASRSQI